ncbi:hypothetical protein SAMN05444166_1306 [Singulisphaera sp. GP187]|uniref:carboxypeptidase-like regulatory domain-containing protein n=1 Tax=Singulisphaera sp. GP187 TaxID=1882752 RepID=UPI0009260D02|nr:carboxypeptidase-like regulatory domain-containing protein [Singulisphaera sp. GP187]SIN85929.1 hypothetical protein SAMN05444166_1306 [Singulisphaera sp. GP187]
MTLIKPLRRRLAWVCGVAFVLGCSSSEPSQSPWEVDPAKLVPAKGVVTLDGKPLAKAVVAFMTSSGMSSVGETNAEGQYVVESAGHKGILPGDYKVSVSYLVSPEGEPQGLGVRSSMQPSSTMVSAVEKLPPEYSDLKQTKLSARVDTSGGTFDFNLVSPVADLATPKAKAAESGTEEAKAEEASPSTHP